MLKDIILYKAGYKYQLVKTYKINVHIPGLTVSTPYLALDIMGDLTIREGYAWDGASGPTVDTKSSMRGSLVHDALYQLMRMALINRGWRKHADDLLEQICIADGMSRPRARVWERAVRWFAGGAARADAEPRIETAP